MFVTVFREFPTRGSELIVPDTCAVGKSGAPLDLERTRHLSIFHHCGLAGLLLLFAMASVTVAEYLRILYVH
jgi:hypothetical protein